MVRYGDDIIQGESTTAVSAAREAIVSSLTGRALIFHCLLINKAVALLSNTTDTGMPLSRVHYTPNSLLYTSSGSLWYTQWESCEQNTKTRKNDSLSHGHFFDYEPMHATIIPSTHLVDPSCFLFLLFITIDSFLSN